MLSIHLKDLSFQAQHGLYEEEKILGNTFILNAHVHYLPGQLVITNLDEAINYEVLFAIINKRMATPTPLLETVVMEICHAILQAFQQVIGVFVSLEKKNPPINNFNGNVVVSFQLDRQQM